MTTPQSLPLPDRVLLFSDQGPAPDGELPDGLQAFDVLRLQGLGDGGWPLLTQCLLDQPELWQDAEQILLLQDGVQLGAAGASELFRVMRQHDLSVAQPSLSWRSHFSEPVCLHNPSFIWHHTNRIETRAMAFSREALRAWLPLMARYPDPVLLARLLPAVQADPSRGIAVVDTVQCDRTEALTDAEMAAPAWPDGETGTGEPPGGSESPLQELGLTWGGLGPRGQMVHLFDETREACLGMVAAGFACAVQEPEPIGEVFLQHFLRSLGAAPEALTLPAATPMSAAAAVAPRLRRSPILPQQA